MKLVNFGCDGNPSLRISSDVINRIKSNMAQAATNYFIVTCVVD